MTRIALLSLLAITAACSPLQQPKEFAKVGDALSEEIAEVETETSFESTTHETTEPSEATEEAPELEPMPEFTIGTTPSGTVAIDQDGITTYVYDGLEYYSVVTLMLTAVDQDEPCAVAVLPRLLRFEDTGSPSYAPAMTFDLGGSIILGDECGWDDDYMLAEFAERGTLTIGLRHDDYANTDALDVTYERSWPMPNDTASITYTERAWGIKLNADRELFDDSPTLAPKARLPSGYYQW